MRIFACFAIWKGGKFVGVERAVTQVYVSYEAQALYSLPTPEEGVRLALGRKHKG